MIVLRLFLVIVALVLGVSFVLYLVTKDRRHLTFIWNVVRFALVLLALVAIFFVIERFVLI